MAFMVHHLKIDDFDSWKPFFNEDPVGRRAAATGHVMFRGVDKCDRGLRTGGVSTRSRELGKSFRDRLLASGALDRGTVLTPPTVSGAGLEHHVLARRSTSNTTTSDKDRSRHHDRRRRTWPSGTRSGTVPAGATGVVVVDHLHRPRQLQPRGSRRPRARAELSRKARRSQPEQETGRADAGAPGRRRRRGRLESPPQPAAVDELDEAARVGQDPALDRPAGAPGSGRGDGARARCRGRRRSRSPFRGWRAAGRGRAPFPCGARGGRSPRPAGRPFRAPGRRPRPRGGAARGALAAWAAVTSGGRARSGRRAGHDAGRGPTRSPSPSHPGARVSRRGPTANQDDRRDTARGRPRRSRANPALTTSTTTGWARSSSPDRSTG